MGVLETAKDVWRLNVPVEAARSARSALVKTALDEGMTGKQLVELLGVPPGLTAQVLDDMDDGDGLGDGADTGHGSPD